MVTRKLALSSLLHHSKAANKEDASAPSPSPSRDPSAWSWPSCKLPRTESFHTDPPPQPPTPGTARTLASIFQDDSGQSSFTNDSSSARRGGGGDDCSGSLSTTASSEASAAAAYDDDDADTDAVVGGGGLLRSSDRLLFDPGASSSILEEKSSSPAAAAAEAEAFVGGLAVAFESADPYRDFRASMEEMVAAHGVEGWAWLEEMLGWYLRANGKDTHAAIVAAFVDVVVSIAHPARGGSCCLSSRTFVGGQ